MMWNGPGWGPMYGWWMWMPFFWIVFMVICVILMSRFFRGGGFCGKGPMGHDSDINDLKKEIQSLREELKELKNK